MRLGLVVGLALLVVACGARTGLLAPDHRTEVDAGPLSVSGKVDLLFMIDNSGSMGDKQELLRQAVPDLLDRLIRPKCVDASNAIVGDSVDGKCQVGKLEFKPVPDIHIAIVTSSLGGMGSDECDAGSPNPQNPALLRHNDDQGHLVNRKAPQDEAVPEASPDNFLAWFPDVDANRGNPKPPVTAISDPAQLVARFQDLVTGLGEFGCGFEGQLESWYRFLVQPDPYAEIVRQGDIATFSGVDSTILQQRHDFLRPDSLLGVIVVSDENDSQIDPRALGGHAWAYLNSTYPGSSGGGDPRPTSACATDPLSPQCRPCTGGSSDPNCAIGGGFYTSSEDPPNVRMFHLKQRFGVDPQYPLSRYVDGLTSTTVPDREGEHPGGSFDYVGQKNCTNPIFAGALPATPSEELCNLPPGPRSPKLVFFAVIGGVPHQLLQVDPTNPQSPQKDTLTEADWQKILGKDPLAYDFTGEDPHMLESITPRPGLPPPSASDTADPIHGREWDSGGQFLQFACTFPLAAPRDCNDPNLGAVCDCAQNKAHGSPLCDEKTPTLQLRGKAYPTIRELALAHALGAQASVSSICPIHVTETQPNDPLYGYRPAIAGIVDAFRQGLVH